MGNLLGIIGPGGPNENLEEISMFEHANEIIDPGDYNSGPSEVEEELSKFNDFVDMDEDVDSRIEIMGITVKSATVDHKRPKIQVYCYKCDAENIQKLSRNIKCEDCGNKLTDDKSLYITCNCGCSFCSFGFGILGSRTSLINHIKLCHNDEESK